ncbi:choice-of-anchor E domain-containing protein [Pseudoduganella sp. FT55W]|uniref:Choice-of-anchor E domain-containing protein n=1 Tax=Duganella rivi TaxID=2666083 RepID=A0A7X4GPL1_9BURK|nr:FxDxF family PEP-CTERM protein [Duganella rivi]MYM66332.1 choice-of-anchor E domain-containing protein [Duganella rivi]
MKKITHIALASLALAAAVDAAAAPAVQSYTVTSNVIANAAVANGGLTFAQFDGSLGTLQSVTVEYFTDLGSTLKVENLSKKSGSSIVANTSGVVTFTIGSLSQGVNYSGTYSRLLPVYDLGNDYAGTSGFVDTITASPFSQSQSYTGASTLAAFTGTATSTMSAGVSGTATSLVTGTSGNTRSLVLPKLDAYAKVTYNYVSAVPEPETYAMLLAGLGLVGVVARRRKSA